MGTSRDEILNRIAALKKRNVELPAIPLFNQIEANGIKQFSDSLKANHAEVIVCKNEEERDNHLRWLAKEFGNISSTFSAVKSTMEVKDRSVEEMKDLEIALLKGNTAVSENGAIWMVMEDGNPRVLPFIVEHLVVVVESCNIVPDMHHAYKAISQDESFSVFIAGPSKTADIEQSLVIGAHGPKKMTVLIC